MTTAAPVQTTKTSAQPKAGSGLWLDVAALLIVMALNWICYVRVINGYFLADDFLHVAYLKQVFAGDWMSLLKNFWGNWMQAEGTTFYRPLISLTLAFDYLLFGANAAGFHLSNLLFQTLSSLLLYLVVTDLARLFAPTKSYTARLCGLAAAALFSVNPLHCEVVAWIISRVDSVACMFYLGAMSLFLASMRKAGRTAKLARTGSLLCFGLSLCSKEMAITLPPTLALLLMQLGPDEGSAKGSETSSENSTEKFPEQRSGERSGERSGAGEKSSLFDRFRRNFFSAFKRTLPFWGLLFAYFILRTLALGTISGGYQGSIGEGLSNSLVKRWFQDGAPGRVLFPLNLDVFGNGHSLLKTLRLLYILAGVNVVAALAMATKRKPLLNAFLFGLGWLVLTLAPTYQVWNLTETLQGSRFVYFATMPLAYMLALAIIPPAVSASNFLNRFMQPLRIALLTAFVIVFATITSKNNQPWHHAMQELKAFQAGLCKLAETDSGKIIVLNIPQSYRGAHMLYNGATMSVMLRPPLAAKDIADRIVTFEPATYGDADLISISRLRRLAGEEKGGNKVFWDRDKLALEPLSLPPHAPPVESTSMRRPLFNCSTGAEQEAAKSEKGNSETGNKTGLMLEPDNAALSPPLNIPAAEIDAIAVKLSPGTIQTLRGLGAAEKNATLCLTYPTGKVGLPLADSDANGELLFQLSEHKNWLRQGTVQQLSLATIGCPEKIEILSVEGISLDSLTPSVVPDGHDLVEGPDGICRVKGARPTFSYDVSNVPGAVSAVCEVSKPNSWFEHYSGTLREREPSKNAAHVIPLNKVKGKNILLSFTGIKGHGFFEIKIAAVDKDGKAIGYFSDPLNFQL